MRNWIAILILSSILLQTFSRAGIYISFKVNQDYIARVLCVNKDKPKLNCNGKCFLAKKLKQAEQAEQQKVLLKTLEVNLCCQDWYTFDFQRTAFVRVPQLVSFYLLKPAFASPLSIFHPPRS
jgi:hypothetical protein